MSGPKHKLQLAMQAAMQSTRKGQAREKLDLIPKDIPDCDVNTNRKESRRWREKTKPTNKWTMPSKATTASKIVMDEARIIAAHELILVEDNEDVIDYVDLDAAPAAVAHCAQAREVLAKGSAQRTASDVEFLGSLVRGVHFFTKKSASELAEIVRELTLLEVAAHAKLVVTGSKAAAFYVILQGAARVYMPIDEEDENAEASQDQNVSDGMVNTHVLEDGDSFSEQGTRLAPDGTDHTRKMEVIAARHSLILVLERSALDTSMARLRESVLQRHTDKLRDVFAFSDWQTEDLRRLAAVVTKRKFNKGVAIVQQGQRVLDLMFFLIEGECRELKQVECTAAQQEMLTVTRDLRCGRGTSSTALTPRGAAAASSKVLLEVGSLKASEHAFFGEVAMTDRGTPPSYTSSIVSSTPVVCLGLSKYDFVHNIDAPTQELILSFSATYGMDDRAIRASISKTFEWEVQKKQEVKHVIANSTAERGKMESPRSRSGVKAGK